MEAILRKQVLEIESMLRNDQTMNERIEKFNISTDAKLLTRYIEDAYNFKDSRLIASIWKLLGSPNQMHERELISLIFLFLSIKSGQLQQTNQIPSEVQDYISNGFPQEQKSTKSSQISTLINNYKQNLAEQQNLLEGEKKITEQEDRRRSSELSQAQKGLEELTQIKELLKIKSSDLASSQIDFSMIYEQINKLSENLRKKAEAEKKSRSFQKSSGDRITPEEKVNEGYGPEKRVINPFESNNPKAENDKSDPFETDPKAANDKSDPFESEKPNPSDPEEPENEDRNPFESEKVKKQKNHFDKKKVKKEEDPFIPEEPENEDSNPFESEYPNAEKDKSDPFESEKLKNDPFDPDEPENKDNNPFGEDPFAEENDPFPQEKAENEVNYHVNKNDESENPFGVDEQDDDVVEKPKKAPKKNPEKKRKEKSPESIPKQAQPKAQPKTDSSPDFDTEEDQKKVIYKLIEG